MEEINFLFVKQQPFPAKESGTSRALNLYQFDYKTHAMNVHEGHHVIHIIMIT